MSRNLLCTSGLFISKSIATTSAALNPPPSPIKLIAWSRRQYCEAVKSEDLPTQDCPDSAIDVAMAVNKIKKMHQSTNSSNEKKNMELSAWSKLNSLAEEKIMSADGKAIALLLNSWAYFSKHWAKGKDGPNVSEYFDLNSKGNVMRPVE